MIAARAPRVISTLRIPVAFGTRRSAAFPTDWRVAGRISAKTPIQKSPFNPRHQSAQMTTMAKVNVNLRCRLRVRTDQTASSSKARRRIELR
ncbi:hypothetical protein D3C80_632340 [compost metagenome]